MANGDIAASIGWALVAPTDDKRMGYDEINKSRDYAASHVKTGTHPWTAIVGRPEDAGDIPTTGGNVQTDLDYVSATANAAGQTAQNALALGQKARDGDVDISVWNRNITWTRQALWMGNDGRILFGYSPSTRAAKQDFQDVPWTTDQVRAIPVILFRYRAEVARARKNPEYVPAVEVGSFADDLDQLGLTEFVHYDDTGKPVSIHYDLLSVAALWLAQRAHDRIDVLEDRIATLEAGAG